MAAVSVDHVKAKAVLEAAWGRLVDKTLIPSPKVSGDLDAVLKAKDVAFKYIMVTGLLGKCTEPAVHPRALQAGSSIEGAYDARSLCHGVVVTFEKTKGDLWG